MSADVTPAPDGVSLPSGIASELAKVEAVVHLRLSLPGHYPWPACASTRVAFGEWWSGDASEVTCPTCQGWKP